LGVHPHNPAPLVERILKRVGASSGDTVPGPDGAPVGVLKALTEVYNLTTPSRKLLELLVSRGAIDLAPLLERSGAERLKTYLSGWNEAHDVLDVLDDHPAVPISPAELVGTMRRVLPRLYSVASSIKAHPSHAHLLVVSVRFTVRGRVREGLCSTYLADRWPVTSTAQMYLQNQQKHFALPADPRTPIIMIGPGTGLAPFRAFIQERRALGAAGRNWLFFGEQHRATEFFYGEELLAYEKEGFLRLDLAFSRDQANKVYVQHRLAEQARDIWAWLEDGAHVYVCGDKERMAADVDRELHRIVETAGGRTSAQAAEYIETLRKTRRYQRDVY
jgi:sulfite reductase (NADPH) flavoprotein alpha-component